MEKLRKIFGGTRMTWGRVLLFAIVTAVYTALINQVAALENTSFRDIAVYLDAWILFAIFIIVNCEKWWEASLKCFVFFLVSQPLIYLIEVPFMGSFAVFGYYRYWFIVTLLTLPGAAVAFFVKKKNMLSALILSVATGLLAFAAATYIQGMKTNFPYHLLSTVFCILTAVMLIFVLLPGKKERAAALLITAAVFIATLFMAGRGAKATVMLGEGAWRYTAEDASRIEVQIGDDGEAIVTGKHNGSTYLCFENENGEKRCYYATVSGGAVWLSSIEED